MCQREIRSKFSSPAQFWSRCEDARSSPLSWPLKALRKQNDSLTLLFLGRGFSSSFSCLGKQHLSSRKVRHALRAVLFCLLQFSGDYELIGKKGVPKDGGGQEEGFRICHRYENWNTWFILSCFKKEINMQYY